MTEKVIKVSVVLATYNGGAYLKDQLESVLNQLPEHAEVIISDNGSTDGTLEIVQTFKHPHVRVLLNDKTKGAKNNFEFALKHATGEHIFLCDQDDIWKPSKIETCLSYLRHSDLICHDCEIVDDNNNTVLDSYFSRRKSGSGVIKNIWANTYIGCCMAFNRKVLNIALPFPEEIPMHDMWLGLTGDLFFKTRFIPERLVSYRMHANNISATTEGVSPFTFIQKFKFRWNILKYFPLLFFRKYRS